MYDYLYKMMQSILDISCMTSNTLLAESLRSFLDESGKRKERFLFPTYLGRSKETLLAR